MSDQQDAGIWVKILSFIIPIVGIFLYFYKKDSQPVYAKSCLIWSLASIVIGFVLAIILSPMG